MVKFGLLLTASAAAITVSAIPAAAQIVTAAAEPAAAADGEQIVVTGSRINRPNMVSSVPITTITGTELLARGTISIGDTLSELPQLRATFTQSNSQRNIGTAAINALDLRGLGTARTLVLVDGRRLITSTPGVNRPDVNNVPENLIESVDIVTGGNSAVYGSDAVAGVVNFVLKQNFDGVLARAQGGISSRGDAGAYTLSLTAGKNFGEGRGNIAASAEYSHQTVLTNIERDNQTGAFSGRDGFNAVENLGANLNSSAGPLHGPLASTGDGIFDTQYFHNIFNNNISDGGLFTASCPNAAAAGESAAAFAARRAAGCSGIANPANANPLAQFGKTFVFNPDGTLTANPCTVDFRPYGSSNCQGGRGSSLRGSGFLMPGLDRKQIAILGHFDFSPGFQVFGKAQFTRVDSTQEGQPTFFNNSFSIDNPFLTPQARATLVSTLAPGQTRFNAFRFDVDFGARGEQHRRDNIEATAGIRGTFFDTWKYEASFNYGRLDTYYRTQGNVLRAQYANSIDATTNAAGQIVCRINAATVTDPACVPVNLFGNGSVSTAALNYFGVVSSRVQKAELYDGTAFVSGDLGKLFTLPGGPIAFVLGGEYRRETAFAAYDSVTSDPRGLTFLNILPDFRPPAEITKEGFVEVSVPLLKDMKFVHELTFDAAGRVSNYNIGSTGTVYAFNVNGTYAPVRDIRFRAGFARSIRAPTQSDLFGAPSQTFLNGLVDPCGQQNINNNPNRVANCAAAGVPTTQTFTAGGVTSTEPFSNRAGSGIAGNNAGNPLLTAEKSDSVTIGAVIQPRMVPGLTLSVDYYHINIKNAIFSLAPQTIINQCYDSTSGINNPFCAVVFRNPNGTFKGQTDVAHAGSTVSFPSNGSSFTAQPFNYAKNVTSGIDGEVTYNHHFNGDIAVNLRGGLTKTFVKYNYTDVTNANFALRQLGTLGDPEWAGQISANLIAGVVNFGYRFRYVGVQTISGQYETQNSTQFRPPLQIEAFPISNYPAITYHDLRVDITVPKTRYQFYVGVDNVTDQLPPYGLQGTENGDPFSPIGRFMYAGVQVKF